MINKSTLRGMANVMAWIQKGGPDRSNPKGFTRLAKSKIRTDLALALTSRNQSWDKSDFGHLPSRLPTMRDPERAQIIFAYMTTTLLEDLQAGRIPANGAKDRIISELMRLADQERNGELPIFDCMEMLRRIFRFFDPRKPVNEVMIQEYFGYRRSVNAGDLVHFYIKVFKTDHPDIIRFDNRYRRDAYRWRADGFGFQIGENLYMVGNAHNYLGLDSLGLRFFALQRFEGTKCLIGPVTSIDSKQVPIAARIVLVPVTEHAAHQRRELPLSDAEIHAFVDRKWTEDEIVKSLATPFGAASDNRVLLHLIDNSTATVLRGKPGGKSDRVATALDWLRSHSANTGTSMDELVATAILEMRDRRSPL
jgi:hypothetical protein